MKRFLPLLLAVPGFGATITYTAYHPGTFDGTPTAGNTATTNWSQNVVLPLFDPLLGTLTDITLQLTGGVFGSARLESQDGSPATINYNLSAIVTATGLNGLSVLVLPAANGVFNATAYDGTTDFGGTSGATFNNLSNADTNSTSSNSAGNLAAYTGVGNFTVALAANGASSSSGSGNLITSFTTQAGALVSVTYTYDDPSPAPEPATFAIVGAGLAAAAFIRRRQ
jgi:hypothetical protein